MSCLICGRPRCERCRQRLADMLNPGNAGSVFNSERPASIPALYAALDATPAVHGAFEAGSSAFGPSAPANEHVLGLRDPRSRRDGDGVDDDGERGPRPAFTVLYAIAHRLDGGALAGPNPWGEAWTVHSLAAWLHVRLDELTEQSWVADAYRHLRELSGQLRAATGDPPPRSVGTCRALVDDDGVEHHNGRWRCAVPLYMPELPPRAPDEPIQLPTLRCSSCGHVYSGAELIQLGRDQHQPIAS